MAPVPALSVAVLLVVCVAGVDAQGGSGNNATCSTDLFRLLPCLPYVEGFVPDARPMRQLG